MNPLYRQYNQPNTQSVMDQFRRFKDSFKGNPQQIVQNLVNSGRISQDQLNQAVRIANELSKFIK